jgi:hypothetical protein
MSRPRRHTVRHTFRHIAVIHIGIHVGRHIGLGAMLGANLVTAHSPCSIFASALSAVSVPFTSQIHLFASLLSGAPWGPGLTSGGDWAGIDRAAGTPHP